MLALALLSCGGDPSASLDPSLLHTVQRGDLVITVRERGEIEAAHNTRIISEVEGRATLIKLVPEGTVVKAGDVVAELDTSTVAEKLASEEIVVAKAEADVQQARKNVEIMEKELRAAESARESELEIAKLRARKLIGQRKSSVEFGADATQGTNEQVLRELRELVAESLVEEPGAAASGAAAEAPALGGVAHANALRAQRPVSHDLVERIEALFEGRENLALQMGDMGNQILKQLREINLSRADLELATETLSYSEKLAAEGFMTRSELNRDRIDFQRRLADMSLAWSDLELLVTYTLPESRITVRQGVADAELALESQRAAAEARRVRESSELARAESELEIARAKLRRLQEQLQKSVMRAPGPGLVVYGRFDWDEPVYEGLEIRERQEIVVLPDVSKMIAKLMVPEAQVDQVAPEQVARLVIDAFPERDFRGRVGSVSTLPDVQGSWRRDVKVYSVRIDVDGDNTKGALRPGMNATVEIEIGTLRGVLQVPLTALERSGDEHYVFRSTSEGPTPVRVTIGRNNLTHVEIVAGLAEGDVVHLVPPEGAKLPAPDRSEGKRKGDTGNGEPGTNDPHTVPAEVIAGEGPSAGAVAPE